MNTNEYIILEVGDDDFIVVSGERIEKETDTSVYPFVYGVTFRLTPADAARIGGQDIITVAESEILQNCERPKATDPPRGSVRTQTQTKTGQLTFFGDTEPQPTLF